MLRSVVARFGLLPTVPSCANLGLVEQSKEGGVRDPNSALIHGSRKRRARGLVLVLGERDRLSPGGFSGGTRDGTSHFR